MVDTENRRRRLERDIADLEALRDQFMSEIPELEHSIEVKREKLRELDDK